ncbi:peptidoglycan/LPS O-acetylase OafA/YrhL [Nocardioides sp. J9]|uniref:acyltransferase family protein n=1 Tax=Nocardioides sp. J9 TaxID=935844 RepID=UPI0011A63BF3|nr:acyltransferase family protein [Nocardioides sp. J9]TWG95127.1 peptidoglycan/LPS O-acetylase OafA/YrhL [Nocardioides sp. J9]
MTGTRSFRSDIQGLRALAVGLVILAHAGFRTASGGFVGVDVFFVISGFLIIGLLVREAGDTGRISILDFYARRARRVIPAATVVLVVTAVAAAYVLPLVRSTEVIKDSVWAAFFGANIRFSLVETDYFAQGEPPSPVQHYWSLSVEEQFYIAIPLLLLLVALWVRRRAGDAAGASRTRLVRRTVFVVLGAVTLASLVWSVVVTANDPTAAYFSTPARAWELGLGGLAATLVWGRAPRLGRWPTEALFAAGLVLVAWATLRFDEQTAMPGTAALVPVLGAVLMLVAGSTTGASSTYLFRLFSIAPARVVGDWSYSLYLWHFPVLRLAQEYWEEPRLSKPHLLVALVVIFALSAASYYLVEQPFRQGVRWRPRMRAITLYPVSLVLVVATALGSQAWVDARLADLADNPGISVSDYGRDDLSRDPAVALVEASVLAAEEDRPVPGGVRPELGAVRESVAPLGECDYRTGTRELCPFGDPDAERTIVVMGDSHARHWSPALTAIGEEHGYAVYAFVYSGCPATTVTRRVGGEEWTECAEFKQWALEQVRELEPDLVVVANNAYRTPQMQAEQVDGLREQLELLRPLAGRVAMIGNSPRLPAAPGTCLTARGASLGDCLQRPMPAVGRLQVEFGETVEDLGMTWVDARRWFCADGRCPAVIGRTVPLRDREHVTVEYATRLAGPLAAALGIR